MYRRAVLSGVTVAGAASAFPSSLAAESRGQSGDDCAEAEITSATAREHWHCDAGARIHVDAVVSAGSCDAGEFVVVAGAGQHRSELFRGTVPSTEDRQVEGHLSGVPDSQLSVRIERPNGTILDEHRIDVVDRRESVAPGIAAVRLEGQSVSRRQQATASVDTGEQVTITVEVENAGESGNAAVVLLADGSRRDVARLELESGGRCTNATATTATLETSLDRAGT